MQRIARSFGRIPVWYTCLKEKRETVQKEGKEERRAGAPPRRRGRGKPRGFYLERPWFYDGKDVFDLSLKKKWPNGIINMIFVARLDSVKRMKDCLTDSEEFFPVKPGQFYRMRNIMGTDTYSVAIRTGNDDSHMVGLNICDFDKAMFYEDVDPDDFGRVEPVSTPEVGDFLVHPLPNEKYEFSFVVDKNRFLTYDREISDFLLHHYLDKYKVVGHGTVEEFLRVAKNCDYDKWVAKVIQMSEDLKNR